jgi:hypothetical protein
MIRTFIKKLNIFVLPFLMILIVNNTIEDLEVQANGNTVVVNSGSITTAGTYLINNISGLQALAEVVNDGSGLSGYTFILDTSLDLDGINWMPIGNFYAFDREDSHQDRVFEGIFDGSGFTISNLTIDNRDASNGQAYNGLFGVTSGAIIRNLIIEDVAIGLVSPVTTATGSVVGRADNSTVSGVTVSGLIQIDSMGSTNGGYSIKEASAFIGHLAASGVGNVSQIINSHVIASSITISGVEHIGGFVGQSDITDGGQTRIEQSSLTASVVTLHGEQEIGSFIGENEGLIEDVQVVVTTINIIGYNSTEENRELGGFVGYSEGSSAIIRDISLNASGITISGDDELGGFVGQNQGVIEGIVLSATTVSITSNDTESGEDTELGGFVGFNDFDFEDSDPAVISGVQFLVSGLTIIGEDELGGFAGENEGPIENITFLVTTLAITGVDNHIGGFVGYHENSSASISNVTFNTSGMTLIGVDEVAGFAGRIYHGRVSNSHLNAGSISITASYDGQAYNGGFVGKHDSGLIENASVTSNTLIINNPTGNGNGGFAGWTSSLSVIDSGLVQATTINIDADTDVGGFVGNHRGTLSNARLVTDSLVMSGVEALGGFIGYLSDNASTSRNVFMTINTGSLYVSSGIVGGFIGHKNAGLSNYQLNVTTTSGLTYNAQNIQSGVTGTLSVPPTTNETFYILIDQLYLGDEPYYAGSWVGKWFEGIATPPPAPAPTPTVPAPVVSNTGTPVTRPVNREIVFTVDNVVLEYGEAVVYPTVTAQEQFGFVTTDVTSLLERAGEIGEAVGEYEVTYTVTTPNLTDSITVTVQVKDTVPPVLTYTGPLSFVLNSEQAATFEAVDNAPGVVEVRLVRDVNTSVLGEQTVSAIATDASGNQTRLDVVVSVRQEQIVYEEVQINDLSTTLILRESDIDIDSVDVFVAQATTQPDVNSSLWQPYTNSSFEAQGFGESVYVKAVDGNGQVVVGSPVRLLYRAPFDPTPVTTRGDVVMPDAKPSINWGVVGLAATGTALAGLGLAAYAYRFQLGSWISEAVKQYQLLLEVEKAKQAGAGLWFVWFYFLLGRRRTYIVRFYDGKKLLSEQEVKHGKNAEAPMKAKWDHAFNDVTEDLDINKVK